MEKELPKGWVYTSFMEVFDIEGGTQPPKSKFISESKKGYIRLLQIRDFGKKPVPTFIPNDGYLRTCEKDDLLIARYGASIGRIVTGMEGAYNVALAKVDIPNSINKQFVYWLLKSQLFQNVITSIQRTAQNGFNKNDLADIILPLPPKPEQDRIVAKLDSLFAKLERVKEGLAKIPVLMKNFRQAVLTQAVTGKLTEEWRVGKELGIENELHANKIDFTSINEIGWAITTIGDYLLNLDTKRVPISHPKRMERQGIYPYYGATGVIDCIDDYTHDGEFILISEDGKNLFFRTKPIAFFASGKIWVNNHAHVLQAKGYFSNHFAIYFFNSINLSEYITGIDQLKLSQKNLNIIPIEIPSSIEQQEIVRRVEALFAQADAIEARYRLLKEKIQHLPQAILAKAFRGELVEQLPTDGDARELLAEIKKMKAGLVGKKVKEK